MCILLLLTEHFYLPENGKINRDIFKSRVDLLMPFLSNDEALQILALTALQGLVRRVRYPAGK